jgi:hypothetical protein
MWAKARSKLGALIRPCVRTAGLIQGQDKLVIRGLCRNYWNFSEVQVFVTNMDGTVEDLACQENHSSQEGYYTAAWLMVGSRVLLASPSREQTSRTCVGLVLAELMHGY